MICQFEPRGQCYDVSMARPIVIIAVAIALAVFVHPAFALLALLALIP